MSKCC